MTGADRERRAVADLLVEAFRQGRPGAFEEIVRAHQDRVFSFCARMLGDREEALDASQEVFLSAWSHLGDFRGESSLSTWLLRIASNRCLNRIRSRASRYAREVPFPEGGSEESPPFDPEGGEGDRPDAVAESAEEGRILEEALGRLDPAWRRLVLLCDVEGYSVEELAASEGIPAGTVKSRLHRARMALRKHLAPPRPGAAGRKK